MPINLSSLRGRAMSRRAVCQVARSPPSARWRLPSGRVRTLRENLRSGIDRAVPQVRHLLPDLVDGSSRPMRTPRARDDTARTRRHRAQTTPRATTPRATTPHKCWFRCPLQTRSPDRRRWGRLKSGCSHRGTESGCGAVQGPVPRGRPGSRRAGRRLVARGRRLTEARSAVGLAGRPAVGCGGPTLALYFRRRPAISPSHSSGRAHDDWLSGCALRPLPRPAGRRRGRHARALHRRPPRTRPDREGDARVGTTCSRRRQRSSPSRSCCWCSAART